MISMRNTQSKFPRSSPVTGSLEGGRNSATRIFPARMFSGQRCRVTISIYGASPLHRLVRSTWRQAYATMLKKAMTSDAVMLVRNIDKAPYHLGSDAEPELRDPLAPSLKPQGTAYILEIEGKRRLKNRASMLRRSHFAVG